MVIIVIKRVMFSMSCQALIPPHTIPSDTLAYCFNERGHFGIISNMQQRHREPNQPAYYQSSITTCKLPEERQGIWSVKTDAE